MTMTRPIMLGLGMLTPLLLPACITINIYFPAAAAEKAADMIIDEVWQLQQQKPAEQAPPNDKPAQHSAPPAN